MKARRRAVATGDFFYARADTCSFLALRNWQLAKKSLQVNPKFQLTAPALAAYFGGGPPPDHSGDELGPEFTADAPHKAALPGIAGREDQCELGRGFEML